VTVCCGGIIGMGEGNKDRASMLQVLASMTPHPESVPINALVAVKGTPLEDQPPVDPLDLVRMVAVARITMPGARVRLSAGRAELTREAQALCFMAGANSIFYGEKLLTTANNDAAADREMIESLGLRTAWDRLVNAKRLHIVRADGREGEAPISNHRQRRSVRRMDRMQFLAIDGDGFH